MKSYYVYWMWHWHSWRQRRAAFALIDHTFILAELTEKPLPRRITLDAQGLKTFVGADE